MHGLHVKASLSEFKCMNYLNAYNYSTVSMYMHILKIQLGIFNCKISKLGCIQKLWNTHRGHWREWKIYKNTKRKIDLQRYQNNNYVHMHDCLLSALLWIMFFYNQISGKCNKEINQVDVPIKEEKNECFLEDLDPI